MKIMTKSYKTTPMYTTRLGRL